MTLFSGCSDWLDVNVDPENPTAGNATYDSRLHILNFIPTVHSVCCLAFQYVYGRLDTLLWRRYLLEHVLLESSDRCRYHSLPMVVLWSCCKYSIFDWQGYGSRGLALCGCSSRNFVPMVLCLWQTFMEKCLTSRVRLKPVLLLPIMTEKQSIWAVWPILTPLSRCSKKKQGSATASLAVGRYLERW